jgi:hypothetical protein
MGLVGALVMASAAASSNRALAIVQKVCVIAHFFFIELHETLLFSSSLITLNFYWFILTSLNFYTLVLD